jgi:hypothetical protein
MNWLATGAQSQALQQQNAVEQAAREAERGKMKRFFITDPGKEARITFVDGALGPQGFLVPPRFYEHHSQLNGKWGHYFVCPEKTMPGAGHKCPICAGGGTDANPYLASLFTIIDHREFTGSDGKVYKDQPRLYVAKPQTFEVLNKIAVKLGGLSCVTFDVSRSSKKAASVGDVLINIAKSDETTLQHAYKYAVKNQQGQEEWYTKFAPADYPNEITFRTPEELLKLGLGKGAGFGVGPIGVAPGGAPSQASSGDFAKQL